jgi:hypothetical protein
VFSNQVKLITGSKIEEGLATYGMDSEIIDIDKFCNGLGSDKISSLDNINATEKLDVIEDEIEQWLQISLNLTIFVMYSLKVSIILKFKIKMDCTYIER